MRHVTSSESTLVLKSPFEIWIPQVPVKVEIAQLEIYRWNPQPRHWSVDSPFAWRCLWGAHIFMPSVFGSQGDDVCVNPMWASLTEHIGTWFFVVHIIPCFSVVYLIYTQGFTLFCCTILNLSKTHSSPNGTGLRSAGSRLRSFTVVPARFTGSRLAEMALQSAPDFWPGS